MLKERFKIKHKIRPVHMLAVLFLFFIFYVGLAALPQFLIHTGKTLQGEYGLRGYIKQIDDQYHGMLETVKEKPLLQNKGSYINLNGFMANVLRQPMMNERVKLKNGHLSRVETGNPSRKDIQKAADNIIRFHDAHTASGGNFLFVMVSRQISKYEDLLPVGYEDTSNATADTFLSMLEEAGVHCLDLREEMYQDGLSITDAYYTTDHHWKPQTGFWAYGKILEELTRMGAIEAVDPFYTDPENYTFETYQNTFLGSSGKRTGIYFAGLDDAILIRPNFETNISVSIPALGKDLQGAYEEVAYNTDAVHNYEDPDFYNENVYGLYGWGDQPITHWRNENAQQQGKLLLIGESYGNVPFSLMSLCLSSCDEVDMRHFDDDFDAYYHSYQPDTVVIELNVTSVQSEFTDSPYLK